MVLVGVGPLGRRRPGDVLYLHSIPLYPEDGQQFEQLSAHVRTEALHFSSVEEGAEVTKALSAEVLADNGRDGLRRGLGSVGGGVGALEELVEEDPVGLDLAVAANEYEVGR